MYCKKCGSPIEDWQYACPVCGEFVRDEDEEPEEEGSDVEEYTRADAPSYRSPVKDIRVPSVVLKGKRLIGILFGIAFILGIALVAVSIFEEEEVSEQEYRYVGDIYLYDDMAGDDFFTDGISKLWYIGGPGTVEWSVKDMSEPYLRSDGNGKYSRTPLATYSGEILTLQPGYYLVRAMVFENGSTRVMDGEVLVDGDVVRNFTWNAAIGGSDRTFNASLHYRYMDFEFWSTIEEWRSFDYNESSSRFIQTDASMQGVFKDLEKAYLDAMGEGAALGSQDFADYLLSFVQCCIKYPDTVRDDFGKYVYNERGSGDLFLYGYEEYWAFPLETIHRASGDCEDTSILFASLVSLAGFDCGLATLEEHMLVAVAIDDFKDRSVPAGNVFAAKSLKSDGRDIFFCETTRESFVPVGYIPKSIEDEVSGLEKITYVSAYRWGDVPDAPDDPVIEDDGPTHTGGIFDLPDGVKFSRSARTLTSSAESEWHVLDILSPVYIGSEEYAGEDFHSVRQISLEPGWYAVTVDGEKFQIIVPGDIGRTAAWTYTYEGRTYDCTLSFVIDADDIFDQDLDSYNWNKDCEENGYRFSEAPSQAVSNRTVRQVAEGLLGIHSELGLPDTKQNMVDFIASFVQLGISYPQAVLGHSGEPDWRIWAETEYWAVPLETLYHMSGDCEDKSLLMAAILKEFGYDAAVYGLSGHMLAGVALDGFVPADDVPSGYSLLCEKVDGKKYYAVELIKGQLPVGYVMDSHLGMTGDPTPYGEAGFYLL